MTVGVLALQGDVREHAAALTALDQEVRLVRRPDDLDGLDGLVLPGGESTTLSLLLDSSGLRRAAGRRPAAGAAGLRHLCRDDPAGHRRPRRPRTTSEHFGLIDLAVRRNGFGRQRASFECDLDVAGLDGDPVHAVFIRAPVVERAGPGVEVLATLPAPPPERPGSQPVLCRQGPVLVSSFHPELTGDRRLHAAVPGHDGQRKRSGEAKSMSGHSKWATTKHQKGAKDAARAKVFAKIIRQVEVAAREGGSDMTANASLRTMYTKARDASVPIDTIERAIKRGSGELEGVRYESIAYEGYAAGRGGGHRGVPVRQPQPHRRGDPQPVQQERRLAWPSPARSAGSSSARG